MSKVSLKEYIREINSLIEENHIREAKEHCAYILKSYPKYIDVYRLLGKAHLESRRYDEAEKIFVRVLAVLPDDFISHLGMSVVKEEQENLDAAIWHMERAYELKSTQTIHEELHRLFTLRDGIAPPKPLITRGALIRINVRSGLYQQALKEIDHALKEDPQRLDLEILRAQIYYQQKNIPLAVRYCKMILQKRPYAYDANLLMTEIASNAAQAEPFKQRMFELDPYTSLVDDNTNLEDVPADAIMIEKLDIPMRPSRNGAEVTDELDQELASEPAQEEDLGLEHPDLPILTTTGNLEDSTLLEANANENAQIPDFMKEAGWDVGGSRSPDEEQALINDYDKWIPEDSSEFASDVVVETDIPDWLKDLKPVEIEETVEEPISATEEEEKIAWLSDILPDEAEDAEGISEADLIQSQDAQEESIPKVATSPFSSAPEFGEDLDADQEWLEMVSSPEPKLMDPSEQSTDRPSRMPSPEEVMDFSFEEPNEDMGEEQTTPPSADEGSEEDIDSAIAWLEGLAAKQGAEEEVLFSDLSDREEKPDWIDQIDTDESEPAEPAYVIEEIPTEEDSGIFEQEDLDVFDEVPEEVSLVEEELPAFGSPESIEEDLEVDDADVPEWLKTIAPPESVEEETTESVLEVETTADESEISIPDELDSLFDDAPIIVTSDENEDLPDIQYPEEEDEELFSEFKEFDEEQLDIEPPAPHTEQFATTAVLDFIKKEVDDEIDEVDDWLKSLPETPTEDSFEEAKPMDKMPEEDIFAEEPELPEELEVFPTEENDVEFIDEYFTEEITNAPKEDVVDEFEEPYAWEQEQEFEELTSGTGDLPDWIAGIEDDEEEDKVVEKVVTSNLTPPEGFDETPAGDTADMPAWMTGDLEEDEVVVDERLEPTEETLQFGTLQEEALIDETVEEVVKETEPIKEPTSTPIEEVEELEKVEDVDYEEVFLIAKNKLHNGDFDDAFPRLRELIENDQWRKKVMDALVFDIENYHPIEVESWVLLGDAYRKQDLLKEALDAYTKAEEFIK